MKFNVNAVDCSSVQGHMSLLFCLCFLVIPFFALFL